jgi:hypothetical protein
MNNPIKKASLGNHTVSALKRPGASVNINVTLPFHNHASTKTKLVTIFLHIAMTVLWLQVISSKI